MAEQAQVTSVDAIEAFRSSLIVYLSKARPTLEEISSDVLRIRQWLENDRRDHWAREMKRRLRELEQAQAELFSARLSRLQQPTAAQYMAAHRAQRAVREAEEKQRVLKKWERELEGRTEPMVKLIDQLHGFLSSEMVKAVAYLGEIVESLQAYAEVQPRPATPVPALSSASDPPPPETEPS
jgi:hypothetical protein